MNCRRHRVFPESGKLLVCVWRFCQRLGNFLVCLCFLGKTKAWLARVGYLCALVGVFRKPILSLTCL